MHDPNDEAFNQFVKAIGMNCISRGISGEDQIQNIINRYKQRLTVDLIRGEIFSKSNILDNVMLQKRKRTTTVTTTTRSYDGCTNQATAIRHGKCNYHGENGKARLQCSHEGCTTLARKGGLCIKHGGSKTTKGPCSFQGCTNFSQIQGVCFRHGATRKLCSSEGCTNQAQNRGLCKRHGAKVKLCGEEGCTKHVERGGFCVRHGSERGIQHGTRKRCTNEEEEESEDGE